MGRVVVHGPSWLGTRFRSLGVPLDCLVSSRRRFRGLALTHDDQLTDLEAQCRHRYEYERMTSRQGVMVGRKARVLRQTVDGAQVLPVWRPFSKRYVIGLCIVTSEQSKVKGAEP